MTPPAEARDFLEFVKASPTPFHVVRNISDRLEAHGFTRLSERSAWSSQVKPGGRYYITRNSTSIIAFTVGKKWTRGNPIAMVGTHTDSPCLKVKPNSKRTNSGFLQVSVEAYGGGIWHTWFDRDLSAAGRIMVRESDGRIVQKLVDLKKPILRIPTLAIHFDRSATFSPNKETDLFPILGLAEKSLNQSLSPVSASTPPEEDFRPFGRIHERHHSVIVDTVAESAGVKAQDIVDLELCLYEAHDPCFGGIRNEFIYSGRLDNLGMTYCAVAGLLASLETGEMDLDNSSHIRLISCFDNEEVGSHSVVGADSNMLPAVLRRLSVAGEPLLTPTVDDNLVSLEIREVAAYEQTLARSFLLSADMAHSIHPNYTGKYEATHQPLINRGTVIKVNSNQRYATNGSGIALLEECARRAKVPLQFFVVRNDSSCGTSIGPILGSKLSVRTIDIGNPQLSMHSIREMGGTQDVGYGLRLISAFFQAYGELETTIDLE